MLLGKPLPCPCLFGYNVNFERKFFVDIFKDEVMETVEVLKSEYSLTRKDEVFIVDFYSYGLTGIVLKWFDEGMEEDPKVLVYKIESIIEGTSKKAFQKFAL